MTESSQNTKQAVASDPAEELARKLHIRTCVYCFDRPDRVGRMASCLHDMDEVAALLRTHWGERWIPIESAPKDGTAVLIGWKVKGGLWEERRAWWDVEFDINYDLRTDIQTPMWRGGWTDNCAVSSGYDEVAEYKPTHWQPLPAPPREEE